MLDIILKNSVLLINMLFAKSGRLGISTLWEISLLTYKSATMLCHVDRKCPPEDHLGAKSFPSK